MAEESETHTKLLEAAGTAAVPATKKAGQIRNSIYGIPGVKFAAVMQEFQQRFFNKSEGPLPECVYAKYRLLRIAPDGPIIEALGGEARAEGPVSAALGLLQSQARGDHGFLQTNGFANIFYARDANGVLCAVRISWSEGGWVVDAIPAHDPLAWNGKHEIFVPAGAPAKT